MTTTHLKVAKKAEFRLIPYENNNLDHLGYLYVTTYNIVDSLKVALAFGKALEINLEYDYAS